MGGFRLLDDGLDEMAAGARRGFPPRFAATIAVGLIVSNLLGWAVTLGWAVWVVSWDALSWVLTRDQLLGIPVTDRVRWKHVICVIGGCAGWTTLGGLLWTRGGAAGAAALDHIRRLPAGCSAECAKLRGSVRRRSRAAAPP